MVKLWWSVVGAEGSAFAVTIDTSESANGLKKVIKTERSSRIECDVDELRLYLAKKGDAWLTENELKYVKETSG